MVDLASMMRRPSAVLRFTSRHTGQDVSFHGNDPEQYYSRSHTRPHNNLLRLREAEARGAQARAAARASATPPRGQALRRSLLMACILVGFFFSLLDMTIVSTSLLATSEDLNGFRDSSWVVLSYLLTNMGFAIFFAKLSDIYGRRNILIVAWAIFVLSSVACGCSYNMIQLIICRAFQGVGGAGLYSLTTIALPEIGPGHRPEIIGKTVGFTLSMSFVLGPVLGGFIPEITSWRVIYWLNGPFAIIAVTGIVFLYPRENRGHRGRSLQRVDFLGSVLLLTSTVLLVIALQQAGALAAAWNSLLVLISLTSAAVCFGLFVSWEYWLSTGVDWEIEPIFPLRLLRNRVYLCCLLVKFLIGYVYLCLIITVPQRFQIVNNESVLKTGLQLLPMLGGTALGCLATGPINAKKNRTSPLVVGSCVLMLAGTSILATVDNVDYPVSTLYGIMVVFGVGFGLFMSAGTMLSTAQAELGDHAVAQGAISQLRILGGIIGLTVFTIIFNNRVQAATVVDALSPYQLDVLRRSPSTLVEMWPELRPLIQHTYADAFHVVASSLAGISGFAVLVSLGTLERHPPSIHGNLVAEKELSMTTSRDTGHLELDDAASDQSLANFHGPTVMEPVPTLFPPPRRRPSVHCC